MSHGNCQAIHPESGLSTPATARLALVAAAAVTLVTWAGAFVAIGIAAPELSPAPFALARLGSAALVLLLAAPLMPGHQLRLPRLADLPTIGMMALLGFPIYHIALNAGQRVVTPGVASLLIATLPIFATVLARMTLKESLSPLGWAGIGVGFIGVALLVTGGANLSVDPNAALVLISAAAGAGFMVTQRFLTRRYSGFTLTIWGIWLGALMLTPFLPQLLDELGRATDAALLSVVYLGVFPTALAYVTWSHVLRSLPAAQATALLFFVPPMAFTLAWLILGTVPTMLDVVGGLVIITGVAIVQFARRQPAAKPDAVVVQEKLG